MFLEGNAPLCLLKAIFPLVFLDGFVGLVVPYSELLLFLLGLCLVFEACFGHQNNNDNNNPIRFIIVSFANYFVMSIEDKQAYLRQQILEKEYDPENFVKFITTHFGMDQTEVLNITLAELKMIVNEFITQNAQQKNIEIPLEQEDTKLTQDEFGEFGEVEIANPAPVIEFDWSYLGTPKKEEPKPVILKPQQPPKTKKQEKKPVVNAALLDYVATEPTPPKKTEPTLPSLLASDVYNEMFKSSEANLKLKCMLQSSINLIDSLSNIRFQVKDHNVQDNTKTYINKLLGSKQILYTVLTQGRNKLRNVVTEQVSRKYSDFEWLRTCLLRKYPGLIIPPLPKNPDIESAAAIISTKNKLTYFLEEISRQHSLRNSKYFKTFLTCNTYSQFEAFRKNNELVEKPSSLQYIENPLGEIECNFSQGLNPFSQLILDYSNKSSLQMKKIKDIAKQITLLFYNINLKFHEMAEVFDKVKGYTGEISNDSKNEFLPLKKLERTYEYLSGLMSDHSTIVLKEKDRIDNFFKDYFSYEDLKLKEIKTLIDKRNEFAGVYAKRSVQEIKDVSPGVLSKFSSALFGQKVESVDTPAPNFKEFKNQYGYYNEQMVKQSIAFSDREVLSYSQHFTRYANEQLSNLDEMQEYWSNVIVTLSRLNVNALA